MEGFLLLDKLAALDAYSHKAVAQFPRSERHVLGADIRATLATIMRLTIRGAKQYYKKTTLQDLDIEIAYMRLAIRKAHALRYIDAHRYEVWSRHVDEIGRMVGGWIKSLRQAAGGGAA